MTNPFRPTYRRLSEAEQEQVDQIQDKAYVLYLELGRIDTVALTPAGERYRHVDPVKGRYVALAETALEEAVMWATKAVTT